MRASCSCSQKALSAVEWLLLVLQTLPYELITMGKIRGNNDGPGGRNESYEIGPRKHVPRQVAVREVEQGKHPGNHVVEINGRKYVRDNPDSSKRDNVNKD